MELQQMQLDERELHKKMLGMSFSDGAKWEPEAYRCLLLRYLEELDKFIDERALKYGELLDKRNIDGIKFDASLVTKGAVMEACLVTEGAALEACLVNEGKAVNDNTGVTESSGTESENSSSTIPFSRSEDENRSSDKDSSSSRNECSRSGNENRSSDHESTSLGNDADADIGPSYDSDIVTENNSNIISDIPNMDPDRNKEEHDDVDYEQQRAFFASLINNLKCDVEKCNEFNREAQQDNALLTNELERIKEKEKHFAKDMTIESE
ncbi:hypothetical protein Tco_0159090 [Tanacetum coccineum]